jgi:hypothetical protein
MPDLLHVVTLDVGRLFHSRPAKSVEFLLRPEWDVVLVQDVYRSVVESDEFRRRFPVGLFEPMTNHYKRGGLREYVGIYLGTHKPVIAKYAKAYVRHLLPVGDLDGIKLGPDGNARADDLGRVRKSECRLVLLAELIVGNTTITVGTTHGSYRPAGRVDDDLRKEMAGFADIVMKNPQDSVVAGNFSVARGKSEIYDMFLKAGLRDRLPPEITNTIDREAHEMKGPDLVVDGIYAKGDSLHVANVALHGGVADHFGISFEVSQAV